MRLYEFKILDIGNQMETVNQKGVYLDNHITENHNYNLYSIDKFFVEVCYNTQKNKITDIKSFIGGFLLDRYSNIDSLFD